MVPVEVAAPPSDVRDKQVLVRLARVGSIELIQRPRSRFDGAGGKLVPLERAYQSPLIIKRELGFIIFKKYHVVIATGTGIAAPLGTGIADKALWLVQLINQLYRLFPARFGDVKVVCGISQNIETGDISSVTQVIQRIIGADGVIRMHMKISIQRAQACRGLFGRDPCFSFQQGECIQCRAD